MELKDMVLQTLNELEYNVDDRGYADMDAGANVGEVEFLHALKERIFVLFEGIRQNRQVTERIVLGFLQFQLALIDARLEAIEKRFMEDS